MQMKSLDITKSLRTTYLNESCCLFCWLWTMLERFMSLDCYQKINVLLNLHQKIPLAANSSSVNFGKLSGKIWEWKYQYECSLENFFDIFTFPGNFILQLQFCKRTCLFLLYIFWHLQIMKKHVFCYNFSVFLCECLRAKNLPFITSIY